MKEVIITKFGPPEVLQIRERPTPSPKSNEVLVRNHFTGVNFSEIMARMRLYPGAPKPPTTLGAEGCGVIESVGKNITKFLRPNLGKGSIDHALPQVYGVHNKDQESQNS